MSITLKVRLPATGGGTGITKSMRFTSNMSVHEAAKNILEKSVEISGGRDHGIYKPISEDAGTKGGKWLRPEKTLEFYDLKTNDFIYFMKKHEQIKVKLVDGTTKTILADLSQTPSEVVEGIAQRIGLKTPEEFSLQSEVTGAWLQADVSVLEQLDSIQQTLVLKKKYFVSDANVDRDDPIQLHLVYVQSRDDIVAGKHPTAKDEAVQLAALQSQIDNGNMNPQISVVQVNAVIAPQWRKEKGIEKLIGNEWKKMAGLTEINAKFRYVQFCRSLKTFGITLFNVKDRPKGAKKIVPKLLGFTRDAIIRMNIDCKTVEKTWPLNHLRRWAASTDTFTMDFGSHEDDYVTVITNEGELISQLIAGYIDILLKKQRDTGVIIDDDDTEVGSVSEVAKVGGIGQMSTTSGHVGYVENLSQSVFDLESGSKAVSRMMGSLFGEVAAMNNQSTMSADQRKQQIGDHQRNVESLASKLTQLMQDPNCDRAVLNATAKSLAQGLEALIQSARTAVATGLDPDGTLFDGVKLLATSIQSLLGLAVEIQKEGPTAKEAHARMNMAMAATTAALAKLSAIGRGFRTDDAFQKLVIECGKAAHQIAQDLARAVENAPVSDQRQKVFLDNAKNDVYADGARVANITSILASTAKEEKCKKTIDDTASSLVKSANILLAVSKAAKLPDECQINVSDGVEALKLALSSLLSVTELPELAGGEHAQVFSAATQVIIESCTSIMGSQGKPELIKSSIKSIDDSSITVNETVAHIAKRLGADDPQAEERMLAYSARVLDSVRKLVATAPNAISNPNDDRSHAQLRTAAQKVMEETTNLTNDAGQDVALSALYSSAKYAAAATTSLIMASKSAKGKISDGRSEEDLLNSASMCAEAIKNLVNSLKQTTQLPDADGKNGGVDIIMNAAEQFAPQAYKLVASCKLAGPKVNDPSVKKDLGYNADNTAKAIHKLLLNRKATKAKLGSNDVSEALELFQGAEAELEATMMSGKLMSSGKSREDALREVNASVKSIAIASKTLATACKETPDDLGIALKGMSNAVVDMTRSGIALASTVDDVLLQKAILNAIKGLNTELMSLIQSSRSVASNPTDDNLNRLLNDAGQKVAAALQRLIGSSKGVIPKDIENFQQKSGNDMEDLAEKELQKAASVIQNAVQRLLKAQEEAKLRRETVADINIDEQNITESILEACGAIGQATSVLIFAATSVQQEFNKLAKADNTSQVYRRDPTWAQGLISAAQEVAASVQHLVTVSDGASKGDSSEEALIVAANQVSASTTRLVTASTVKNVNDKTQSKLLEASKSIALATKALVDAARAASDFKEQNANLPDANEDGYSLSQQKIAEMEQQMEILRLEKELDKKRQMLLQGRKQDYAANTNKPPTKTPPQKMAVKQPMQPPQQQPPQQQQQPLPQPVKMTPNIPHPIPNQVPPPVQQKQVNGPPVKTLRPNVVPNVQPQPQQSPPQQQQQPVKRVQPNPNQPLAPNVAQKQPPNKLPPPIQQQIQNPQGMAPRKPIPTPNNNLPPPVNSNLPPPIPTNLPPPIAQQPPTKLPMRPMVSNPQSNTALPPPLPNQGPPPIPTKTAMNANVVSPGVKKTPPGPPPRPLSTLRKPVEEEQYYEEDQSANDNGNSDEWDDGNNNVDYDGPSVVDEPAISGKFTWRKSQAFSSKKPLDLSAYSDENWQ